MDILVSILLFFSVIVGLFIVVLFIACSLCAISYYKELYWHKCKYCGKKMYYYGLKGDACETHHVFHCTHCGSWEQITQEDFIKII